MRVQAPQPLDAQAVVGALDEAFAHMRSARESITPALHPRETGTIVSIGAGIACLGITIVKYSWRQHWGAAADVRI